MSRVVCWIRRLLIAWLVAGVALVLFPMMPVLAAPAPNEGAVHVVLAGETLSGIAERYGISPTALANANGLNNPNFVYAGQRLTIPSGAGAQAVAVSSAGGVHVVGHGESLHMIATRYGTTIDAIARANGISNPNFVYVGQRLSIPGASSVAAAAPASTTTGRVHVVQVGQSLSSIAAQYGVTTQAIASANGLSNPDFVFAGQRLTIPSGGGTAVAPAAVSSNIAGRWIGVNLSAQTLTAYEGNQPVFSTRVSTGTAATPTLPGRFQILTKYPSVPMSGPGYYLPNVPWTMFYHGSYAIHGTYWHSNFGVPMSRGCVNLSIPDAEWVYNFASIGTPVVIHY